MLSSGKNEHIFIIMSEIENNSIAVFDLHKKEFIFFRPDKAQNKNRI